MAHPPPVDVAVIGAGPAGLAAAGSAARSGARVLLIDAATQFGGQYWRHGDERTGADQSRWHHGWRTFTSLAGQVHSAITAGAITYLPGTQAWSVQQTDDGYAIHTAAVPEAHYGTTPPPPARHLARTLILCPGTFDRQVPIPGWTLPGVMAAGGVQAFVKTQHVAPGRRIMLGGTGPFLLAAAASVLQAGATVVGIAEAAGLRGWIPRGISALGVPGKLLEGVRFTSLLARRRVPYRTRTAITAIHGTDRVEAVSVSSLDARGVLRPGTTRRIEGIDVVGLGWGFTPQTELLLQLGLHTRVDRDGSLVGVVDGDQQASAEGVFLAGEITGVAGAGAAVAEGRIAGKTAAARARGPRAARPGGGLAGVRDRWTRTRHHAFAAAMHQAHPLPQHWPTTLTDDTVVCRCEEVPWGRVRTAAAELQAGEPRGIKGTTRLGMGWCQGRICALAAICAGQGPPGDVATSAAGADTSGWTAQHRALHNTSRRPVAMPITFATMSGSTAATSPSDRCDAQTTKESE